MRCRIPATILVAAVAGVAFGDTSTPVAGGSTEAGAGLVTVVRELLPIEW